MHRQNESSVENSSSLPGQGNRATGTMSAKETRLHPRKGAGTALVLATLLALVGDSHGGWDPVGDVKNAAGNVKREVGRGAENLKREVSKGAENVKDEVGKGTENLEREVSKGAGNVQREVGKGGENFFHTIGDACEDGYKAIAKPVSASVNKMGLWISKQLGVKGIMDRIHGLLNQVQGFLDDIMKTLKNLGALGPVIGFSVLGFLGLAAFWMAGKALAAWHIPPRAALVAIGVAVVCWSLLKAPADGPVVAANSSAVQGR